MTEMLPTFFVIGAPRSGTTSVYEYLNTHPDIFMSPVKEPEFFARPDFDVVARGCRRRSGSLDELAEMDPVMRPHLERYQALFERAHGEKQRGEASSIYLAHPTAAEHLHDHVPNARLIAILRDPTERAYSHYVHTKRMYVENGYGPALGAPGRTVDEEFRRVVDAAHRDGPGELATTDPEVWVRTGLYFRHLSRFYSLFPEEQVHVILFDDLVADVHAVMADVFHFLEVDESFVVPTTEAFNASVVPHNPGLFTFFTTRNSLMRYGRSLSSARIRAFAARTRNRLLGAGKPPLDPELRRKFAAIYRDDVRQLQGLIGRDLSGWLHDG